MESVVHVDNRRNHQKLLEIRAQHWVLYSEALRITVYLNDVQTRFAIVATRYKLRLNGVLIAFTPNQKIIGSKRDKTGIPRSNTYLKIEEVSAVILSRTRSR